MKNTGKLLVLGAAPLAAGVVWNALAGALPLYGLLGGLVGVGLLCLWVCGVYRWADPAAPAGVQAMLACALGAAMLALALWQELAAGRYWDGLAGLLPQMYFLPLLSLASGVFSPVLGLLFPSTPMWSYLVLVFLTLLAAAWLACRRKKG